MTRRKRKAISTAEAVAKILRDREAVIALRVQPDEIVYQWPNGLCVGMKDDGTAFACGIVNAKRLKVGEVLDVVVRNGVGEFATPILMEAARERVLKLIDETILAIPVPGC